MNILTHKQSEFTNIFMNDLFRNYSAVRSRSMENIKGLSNYMFMIEGVDKATMPNAFLSRESLIV